jgi:hypothetical protein
MGLFVTKRLLWCIVTLKIKGLEQFFNLILEEQTKSKNKELGINKIYQTF